MILPMFNMEGIESFKCQNIGQVEYEQYFWVDFV